jgi:CRP-like cAMP-binding protein
MHDIGQAATESMAGLNQSRGTAKAPSTHLETPAVEFFADALADLGRVFSGDMRAATIFVLLARAAMVGGPANGMTQSEIAAASGIPRETVRRKLAAMERLGWIGRREMIWYIDADLDDAEGARRFAALRGRFLQRATDLFEEVLGVC